MMRNMMMISRILKMISMITDRQTVVIIRTTMIGTMMIMTTKTGRTMKIGMMTRTMILMISTLVIHKEDLPPADEDLVTDLVQVVEVPVLPTGTPTLIEVVHQAQIAVEDQELRDQVVVLLVRADLQAHLPKEEALQVRVLPTEILVILPVVQVTLQNADLVR